MCFYLDVFNVIDFNAFWVAIFLDIPWFDPRTKNCAI